MELFQKTAHELRDLLKDRQVSSVEVTKAYLNRIESVDDNLEAYLTVCKEEALKKAVDVDEKRAAQEQLHDLAGIPIALKDNICTNGIQTTCGSKILHNFVPPYDGTAAKKLAQADTVLLGKVNMDEFAMGSSTENSYFQKTKNPWSKERVPGGSSGGSAAAVAADMAAFTLGSDTGGSIRQPAHFCGVVGMKPTYGAVSRFGLVAFASSLDQIGPLTKDIQDMALAMNVITGYDPHDSTSAPVEYPNYTSFLHQDVKGLKVALPKEYFGQGIQEDVRNSVMEAVKKLEELGANIEEVSMPMTDYALPAYYLISSAEASSNLARFDGVKYGYRSEQYKDLLDLYKQTRDEGFGAEVKRRIMLGTYALSSGYYDAYYKKAQQVRTLIKNEFDSVFSSYDLILTPTAPTTAFKINEKADNPLEMYMSDICTVPINIAGVPALSMPCGFDSQGLPIGVQLVAKAFGEGTIIKAAYNLEVALSIKTKKPQL